jgi:hypothetical protein
MIIEIGYTFQSDKKSPAVTSWTYFYVKGVDTEKAKRKAKTYWKKFCDELGYKTTQVKLNHIEEIQNGTNYKPDFIVVSESELPPARKSRSTPPPKTSLPPRKSSRSSLPRTRKSKKV